AAAERRASENLDRARDHDAARDPLDRRSRIPLGCRGGDGTASRPRHRGGRDRAAAAAHARGASDAPFPRDLRRALGVALLAGRRARECGAVSLAYASHGRELPRFLGRAGGAAGIVLVLVVWGLLARAVLASSLVLPTPLAVAPQMWRDRHFFLPARETAVEEAALGFLWGNLIAIAIAIVFVLVPLLERGLMRLAIAVYCLPLLAIGPILQIVQSEEGPKITLAALSVFFTTLIATMLGLRSADPASLELIHVYGGGTWDALRKVRVRAALPAVLAGLRIAAPAALLGAIIGELLGGTQGLGVAMVESQSSFEVSRTWGIALVTGALAGLGYA